MPKVLHGIEMNDMEQMCLLDQSFRKFYEEMPFEPNQTEGLRYYLDNHSYVYADGIFLYCMLRYLKPKRVIEIGSGSPHV